MAQGKVLRTAAGRSYPAESLRGDSPSPWAIEPLRQTRRVRTFDDLTILTVAARPWLGLRFIRPEIRTGRGWRVVVDFRGARED